MEKKSLITIEQARDMAESFAIKEAMTFYKGNVSKAAIALGTSRVSLYRLLDKHGFIADSFRCSESTGISSANSPEWVIKFDRTQACSA